MQLRLPLVAIALGLFAARAASAQGAPERLLDLSIEELSQVEVTSASKRPEPLASAAAAIYVITSEDIRRSGATTIPELLRLVPGLEVARIGSHRWAITSRGFNGQFSNKLLVLIDGRSVYSPVHSGVNWDVQDTLLRDIDRIEVIRGPGATLWGANAVNGVINIITKSARDTLGGAATLGTGTEQPVFGSARWGDTLGEHGAYRAYAKYLKRDAAVTPSGEGAGDAWWQGRTGFRTDWGRTERDQFTFQGDFYNGEVEQIFPVSTLTPPFSNPTQFKDPARGANLLGRWTHAGDDGSQLSLQGYVDWAVANPLLVREEVLTFDLDLQERFRLGDRHEWVWGLGYRRIHDDFERSFTVYFEPDSRSVDIFSAFLQDTVTLSPDTLFLTLGSKFEHNDFSGFEVQPSLRLAWTPTPRQAVWGAISRAVRTPSRAERDIVINIAGPGPTVIRGLGATGMEAENLWAYELGYRIAPTPRLFLDFAAFYNEYTDLVATRAETPFVETDPAPAHLVAPLRFYNGMDGETYGIEFAGRWQAADNWRLDLTASLLDVQTHAQPGSVNSEGAEGDSAEHQIGLRSLFNLSPSLELDGFLRHVGPLSGNAVPAYTALDLRLGWQARPGLELQLVGQNLLDARHPEFDATTELERSGYVRVDWRF